MGPFELLILLFVIFLVVGPKRITALFRSMGRGARDFTDELSSSGNKNNEGANDEGGAKELPEDPGDKPKKT